MISSRPLCMQNIFNTIQTQNRTLGITSWQKTLLVAYDMKSACGKVLNPNMNASKTKEKTSAQKISWLHLSQMLFQHTSSCVSKLRVISCYPGRVDSKDFSQVISCLHCHTKKSKKGQRLDSFKIIHPVMFPKTWEDWLALHLSTRNPLFVWPWLFTIPQAFCYLLI